MNPFVYLIRDVYNSRTTHAEFFFGQEMLRFAYGLEDTVRADYIKVYGETAIKGGTTKDPEIYNLTLHYSNKFKREVVMLSNTDKPHLIKHGNVEFGYVYVHGGNKHADSLGCILIARNRNLKADTIQGTMEKDFTARVKELLKTGEVKLCVINKPQSK